MYIATFFTHFGAESFRRRLIALGDQSVRLCPAPRALSVSCGTAAVFSHPFDLESMVDDDVEAVYIQDGATYQALYRNEDA